MSTIQATAADEDLVDGEYYANQWLWGCPGVASVVEKISRCQVFLWES
ncbi:MAG: hypothetical protein WBA77_20145 [Microcoleaceae cyanobacterium]